MSKGQSGWRGYGQQAHDFLVAGRIDKAEEILLIALRQYPDQPNLLASASDLYRTLGDREKAYKYSESLLNKHPNNSAGYCRAVQDLIALQYHKRAEEVLHKGLDLFDGGISLLTAASDLYRSLGDIDRALRFSKLIVSKHPDNMAGYYRAVQDLMALRRLDEAEAILLRGLHLYPDKIGMLVVASDLYRALDDTGEALRFAEFIVSRYPSSLEGYYRAAQALISLKRLDEAEIMLLRGLDLFPHHIRLLTIASDLYRRLGHRQKSLMYSKLLISKHTKHWIGYKDTIVNLIILGNDKEAKQVLHAALGNVDSRHAEAFRKFSRYFEEETLLASAGTHIRDIRYGLKGLYARDKSCMVIGPDKLFSDVILVANNGTLRFDENDVNMVSKMKNPLFVYLNVGNPAFTTTRDSFWHPNCSELVYGRPQWVLDKGGKMAFRPYNTDAFVGCFLISKPAGSWLQRFENSNPGIRVSHLTPASTIIRSHYPKTMLTNTRGEMKARMPSMGWFALALFDSLSAQQYFTSTHLQNAPRLWAAGFTLSPSYIFEISKTDFHDHIFERAALRFRREEGTIGDIGNTNNLSMETSFYKV